MGHCGCPIKTTKPRNKTEMWSLARDDSNNGSWSRHRGPHAQAGTQVAQVMQVMYVCWYVYVARVMYVCMHVGTYVCTVRIVIRCMYVRMNVSM